MYQLICFNMITVNLKDVEVQFVLDRGHRLLNMFLVLLQGCFAQCFGKKQVPALHGSYIHSDVKCMSIL